MIKVNIKQERSKLSEGRTTGMGFAFLKKINNNTFDTVIPISPCKDYLNDVIYTETTGIPMQACGLVLGKKFGIFDNTDKAYIAIQIMKANETNSDYKNSLTDRNFDGDTEWLVNNFMLVEQFINHFEEMMGIDKTTIDIANDNIFVLTLSLDWCKTSYLISLYTFLVRCSLYWSEDKKTPYDVLKFLATTSLNNIENSIAYKVIKVIDAIKSGDNYDYLKKQDMNDYNNPKPIMRSIHSQGILTAINR